MTKGREDIGWFAGLRRDRMLFVVAASLLLVSHLFQPLAQARAADTPLGWSICTAFGMEMPAGQGQPDHGTDACPLCLAAAGVTLAALALPPPTPDVPSIQPLRQAAVPAGYHFVPLGPVDLPPAIRAPPSSL